MNKNIFKTILITTMLFPSLGMAAFIYPSIGGNIMFSLDPKNPAGNTPVTIKVESYALDISSAKISWYVGDKITNEGIGADTFSFKTGDIGKNIIIRAIVEGENQRIGRAIAINPAEVDVIWEANNYVPPFYKGKVMAPAKSSIKIVAIPHLKTENGTMIPSENIVYEWRRGTSILLSGMGKNILRTEVEGVFGGDKITLTATDKSGSIVAEKTIKISPEEPEIIFYKENPAEGTNYNNSISRVFDSSDKEISVRAEPFFFSYPSSSRNPNLSLNWSINGKGVFPNDGTPKIITLRNESGQELTSDISLSIKNIQTVFQKASNIFTLKSLSGFKF